MENSLQFKNDVEPVGLSEDFYYMINGGGWCAPEKFLEPDDAKKVQDAIDIIAQYEKQGTELGLFEEM